MALTQNYNRGAEHLLSNTPMIAENPVARGTSPIAGGGGHSADCGEPGHRGYKP